jgi:hypothetical protein
MNLYLDGDSIDHLLIRLLRNAGHDVRIPADLGLSGRQDSVHLRYAVREGRVFLTGNHDDFEFLHDLVLEDGGHHPGILIVRRDNNPKRDLSPKGTVRAIAKLLAAQTQLVDQFVVLNHWR